jgi:uncharacterized protein YbaA (DUF1428 family)
MARYVDGFLLAVPRRKLAAYAKISTKAGQVWKHHGALEYVECVIDDSPKSWPMPFAKMARAKPGEAVVFSWITYKSRAHRDAVNKKVMSDPRMQVQDPKTMPFDHQRMAWGGFKPLVDL